MSRHRTGPIRRAINATADRVQERLMRARLGYPIAETALIVVDAQHDLLSQGAPGSVMVERGVDHRDRIAALGNLVTELRALGVRVIFANHGPIAHDTERPLTTHQQVIARRELFAVGTQGAQLVPPLAAQPDDLIVTPHTGLSAFTDTDLTELLDGAGIVRVIVAGALTETTVDATARSAVERGMQVTIAADACIGTSAATNETHLRLTLPRVVHAVLDSHEILRRSALAHPQR